LISYLELHNLSKSFSTPEPLRILDGVSLSLERGELVCLLGPSGCGKSTLLRIIAGLIPADSGEARIGGTPITRPGRDRSMVFQQSNLFPWRTALGNVMFGLHMHGVPRTERIEKARHYLELVGLRDFAQYYPSQLSGGMQQRVNLARALAVQPEILLMDEPFAALDAQTRESMQEELLRIWSLHQHTIFFVTHDIEEALFLADRVLIMSSRPGRIVHEVSVPFDRPRSESLRSKAPFAEWRGTINTLLKQAKLSNQDK
jgi:NitT/TauT family transport system ATP-binding protein